MTSHNKVEGNAIKIFKQFNDFLANKINFIYF